ncbi:MAG: hypothetical protein ISS82_06075 [Nanoarchaeota archaeon]|nr:hypothetical protein [Nanoarchaeota archaeon]
MNEKQKIKLNEKILKGLRLLGKGLVEHGILHRSKLKGVTHEQIFQNEYSDMERFRGEMFRIKDPDLRELTRALTNYACAFYKLIQREGVENYKRVLDDLDEIYEDLDEKYDGLGREEKELVEALKKYHIYFYRFLSKNGSENSQRVIEFLNKFFWEMDNKYYSELEGKSDDMKQLAEYLNEIKI